MKKLIYLTALALTACGYESTHNANHIDTLPPIYPDYTGVTVPLNICPLNFDMADDGYQMIDATIEGNNGYIHCQNKGAIEIPMGKWRKLLAQNAGDTLRVTVCAKKDGKWSRYNSFGIAVSTDSIDYAIVYRRIAPAFETFSNIGIYERDLSSFDEHTIMDDNLLQMACMNCHNFNRNNPDDLILHVRGPQGGTFIQKQRNLQYYNTKTDSTLNNFAYSYWHPDGRYIVFSMNTTRQIFHTAADKRIDVFDGQSDICVYDSETEEILYAPHLRTHSFENFPAFSADGSRIYFATADSTTMPLNFEKIRYYICSVGFDANGGTVGATVDTIIDLRPQGLSASVPKPSFDGKYIMFNSLTHGNFPIWHSAADLWLHNIATGDTYPLTEANSPKSEAYHNWSSNSHWYCVASRRDDDLHSRLYFARIGDDGKSTKPFMLPQIDPKNYYEQTLQSFNSPEFSIKPVGLNRHAAEKMYNSPDRRRVTLQGKP